MDVYLLYFICNLNALVCTFDHYEVFSLQKYHTENMIYCQDRKKEIKKKDETLQLDCRYFNPDLRERMRITRTDGIS